MGTLAASIINTMRRKKSDKVWTWQDVFPHWADTQVGQSTEDQIAIVELLNEAFGGKDIRKDKTTIAG